MKVTTTHGEMDHSTLVVKDVVTWADNCRVVATEWYQGDEIVRRDVWVSVLHVPEIGVTRAL